METRELNGAVWVKSTRSSGGGNGDCVEVATNLAGVVGVRDSKDVSAGALTFTPAAWTAFADGVKTGEYDF